VKFPPPFFISLFPFSFPTSPPHPPFVLFVCNLWARSRVHFCFTFTFAFAFAFTLGCHVALCDLSLFVHNFFLFLKPLFICVPGHAGGVYCLWLGLGIELYTFSMVYGLSYLLSCFTLYWVCCSRMACRRMLVRGGGFGGPWVRCRYVYVGFGRSWLRDGWL
jgi:hypothetical protein